MMKYNLSESPVVSPRADQLSKILNILAESSREEQADLIREVVFNLLNERADYERKCKEEWRMASESKNYLENAINDIVGVIQQEHPVRADIPEQFLGKNRY